MPSTAVIVLAHDRPAQVAQLLRKLEAPELRAYLHVDRAARLASFRAELARFRVSDVTLLDRHRTRWGGFELVAAALGGLRRAVADGCNYFLLVSGQDYPLRTGRELAAFCDAAGSRSYLEFFSLPAARWRLGGRDRTDFYAYNMLGRREACIPRGEDVSDLSVRGRALNALLRIRSSRRPPRRHPAFAQPFGGSQWWNLSRPGAEHVLDFLARYPEFVDYHRDTLAPDELFFQTILLGTDYAAKHEIVNNNLRFMVWDEGASHPRLLASEEVRRQAATGEQLFARKVDAARTPDLFSDVRP